MSDPLQPIDVLPDGRGRRALVLASGGMDSTVSLFLTRSRGFDTFALEFDNYTTKVGMQRPASEGRNVEEICRRAGAALYRCSFPVARRPGGADAAPVSITESTMLYFTLAGAVADSLGAEYLIASYIKDDWFDEQDEAGDRHPDHYDSLNRLLRTEYGERAPQILAPLIHLTKTEVARLGRRLGAPLDITWSCTRAHDVPCGECGQCRLRERALRELEQHVEGEAASGRAAPPA